MNTIKIELNKDEIEKLRETCALWEVGKEIAMSVLINKMTGKPEQSLDITRELMETGISKQDKLKVEKLSIKLEEHLLVLKKMGLDEKNAPQEDKEEKGHPENKELN